MSWKWRLLCHYTRPFGYLLRLFGMLVSSRLLIDLISGFWASIRSSFYFRYFVRWFWKLYQSSNSLSYCFACLEETWKISSLLEFQYIVCLVSSDGRAPVCWAGGRGFKPRPNQNSGSSNNWEENAASVMIWPLQMVRHSLVFSNEDKKP